jgi:hypothetical protein
MMRRSRLRVVLEGNLPAEGVENKVAVHGLGIVEATSRRFSPPHSPQEDVRQRGGTPRLQTVNGCESNAAAFMVNQVGGFSCRSGRIIDRQRVDPCRCVGYGDSKRNALETVRFEQGTNRWQ